MVLSTVTVIRNEIMCTQVSYSSMITKLLISGGSGFIGQHLIDVLTSSYDKLEILSVTRHHFQQTNNYANSNVRHISFDIRKEINFNENIETLVHMAAETKDESKMWKTNYEGTKNLLKWSMQHGVKKIIYLSSVAVYGANCTHYHDVSEESLQCPTNIYGKSKSAAEELTRELCALAGIQYTILRPANVIGVKFGGGLPLLSLMRSIKKGYFFYIGNFRSQFNYISAEDVASCIALLINEQCGNSSYILNTPIMLKQAVDTIAETLNVNAPKKTIPYWVGMSLGHLGTSIGQLLSRQLPFSHERLIELTNSTRYRGDLITKTIGFHYSEGIINTLRKLAERYARMKLL